MQPVQQVQPKEERQVSRHSLFVSVLFPTCVHSLLEGLGFTCYVLILVPMFCPFHDMVCAQGLAWLEKYACMREAVHILQSINSTAVVEEPCTSLDGLTFDSLCLCLCCT